MFEVEYDVVLVSIISEPCANLDRHWEWGWHYVLERGADGSWEIVLQAEY